MRNTLMYMPWLHAHPAILYIKTTYCSYLKWTLLPDIIPFQKNQIGHLSFKSRCKKLINTNNFQRKELFTKNL